jgi:dihydroorotase
MTKILLKGGRIYDFGLRIDEVGDLLIENGRIASVGGDIALDNIAVSSGEWTECEDGDVKAFNCAGKIVSPGFIDLHVHLREPGDEAKETIKTGTLAAVRGGFTSVAAMPNTNPPIADKTSVAFVQDRADETAHCRVFPVGAVTRGRAGDAIAPFPAMIARGVTMFSDDGADVADAGVLYKAMQALSAYPATVCIHAEEPTLSHGGVMHDGAVSARLGYVGAPAIAETASVARAILIAEAAGAPLHICHVSAAGTIELIRYAKAKGLPVTAEVTPQHLLLTDEAVETHGAVAKVNPPLRSDEDRRALVAALADGTIDCIATDHAPHTADEKELGMERAPSGIIGLETCAGLIWRHLVQTNKLPMQRFFDALTTRPAHVLTANQLPRDGKMLPELTARGRAFHDIVLAGIGALREGAVGDIVVFDPDTQWTVDQSSFATKAKFTPFEGWEVQGKAVLTVVAGFVRHKEAKKEALR